jgi:hypothetical protein
MSLTLTLTLAVPVTFHHPGRGSHQELPSGAEPASLPLGRVPRVARLMALALRLDDLVRSGQVASSSALASLGHVSNAAGGANCCSPEPGPARPGQGWPRLAAVGRRRVRTTERAPPLPTLEPQNPHAAPRLTQAPASPAALRYLAQVEKPGQQR